MKEDNYEKYLKQDAVDNPSDSGKKCETIHDDQNVHTELNDHNSHTENGVHSECNDHTDHTEHTDITYIDCGA